MATIPPPFQAKWNYGNRLTRAWKAFFENVYTTWRGDIDLVDNQLVSETDIQINADNVYLTGFKWPATYSGGVKILKLNASNEMEYIDPTELEDLTPTGVVGQSLFSDIPSGWVSADGRYIGNSNSSANNRANIDTWPLYYILWNNTNNLVGFGKGVSAAQDFIAGKPIQLPNYNGSACGCVSDDHVLGQLTGSNNPLLTASNLPPHTHEIHLGTGGGAPPIASKFVALGENSTTSGAGVTGTFGTLASPSTNSGSWAQQTLDNQQSYNSFYHFIKL